MDVVGRRIGRRVTGNLVEQQWTESHREGRPVGIANLSEIWYKKLGVDCLAMVSKEQMNPSIAVLGADNPAAGDPHSNYLDYAESETDETGFGKEDD